MLFHQKAAGEAGTWTLQDEPRKVLLRSSWQTVNIGDMAHTFGALQALKDGAPSLRLVLWPCCVDRGVREQLLERFPDVAIVDGGIGADGQPDTPELRTAFADCDLLLHGSGPGPVRAEDCAVWHRMTGKPYGFFGITVDPWSLRGGWEGGTLAELRKALQDLDGGHLGEPLRGILARAAFIYCRDTLSADYLRSQGLGACTRVAFGPDAVFANGRVSDASVLLQDAGLEDEGFLCVVPRLRWTPYHTIAGAPVTAVSAARDAVNLRTAWQDHESLRGLIVRWVRKTGRRVLVCPEMTYQVALGRQQLYDPLPGDVRRSVVCLDRYWLCDEAAAVYARAGMVVSMENHSPILALAQGTPVAYVRQPTDTVKGQMWHDLGLSEAIFEVGEVDGPALWERASLVIKRESSVLDNGRRARDMAVQHLASMAGAVAEAARPTDCLAVEAENLVAVQT